MSLNLGSLGMEDASFNFGGSYIMALVLGDLVQFRNLEGRVVVNLSCSTLVRRIAEALGCRVAVKPVGFKYIAAEMLSLIHI